MSNYLCLMKKEVINMIDNLIIVSPKVNELVFRQLEKNSKTRIEIDKSTGEIHQSRPYGTIENEYGIPIYFTVYPCHKLRLEANIHELLAGHNILGGPKDFYASAAYLVGQFKRYMGIKLPPAMEWGVERVDVAECYVLESQSKCDDWFCAMRNNKEINHEIIWYGNYCIFIPGEKIAVKIYNKGREQLNEGKYCTEIDIEKCADCAMYLANRVIKAEVQINIDQLADDLGNDFTVKDVSNEYLNELHDIGMNMLFELKDSGVDWKSSSDYIKDYSKSDFSPIRDNKYHYDVTLKDVKRKLKPYIKK